MLKIFYLSERLGEEIFNRTIKLFEVGYHRFKYDGDECIIFKSEDQDAVSNYLGISNNFIVLLKISSPNLSLK